MLQKSFGVGVWVIELSSINKSFCCTNQWNLVDSKINKSLHSNESFPSNLLLLWEKSTPTQASATQSCKMQTASSTNPLENLI